MNPDASPQNIEENAVVPPELVAKLLFLQRISSLLQNGMSLKMTDNQLVKEAFSLMKDGPMGQLLSTVSDKIASVPDFGSTESLWLSNSDKPTEQVKTTAENLGKINETIGVLESEYGGIEGLARFVANNVSSFQQDFMTKYRELRDPIGDTSAFNANPAVYFNNYGSGAAKDPLFNSVINDPSLKLDFANSAHWIAAGDADIATSQANTIQLNKSPDAAFAQANGQVLDYPRDILNEYTVGGGSGIEAQKAILEPLGLTAPVYVDNGEFFSKVISEYIKADDATRSEIKTRYDKAIANIDENRTIQANHTATEQQALSPEAAAAQADGQAVDSWLQQQQAEEERLRLEQEQQMAANHAVSEQQAVSAEAAAAEAGGSFDIAVMTQIEQQATFLTDNAKKIWENNQWMSASQAVAQAAVDFSGMIANQNPGDWSAQQNHQIDLDAQAIVNSNPYLDWGSARGQAQFSYDTRQAEEERLRLEQEQQMAANHAVSEQQAVSAEAAAAQADGQAVTLWQIDQQADWLAPSAKEIWLQNQSLTASQATAQAAVNFSQMIMSQNPGDVSLQVNYNLDVQAKGMIDANPSLDWGTARNTAQANFDNFVQLQNGGGSAGTPDPAVAASISPAPEDPFVINNDAYFL